MTEKLDLPSDKILYQAVMEIKEPVIFQQILQNVKGECWKLFEWNLSELAEKFGDIKLPFRVGYNARSMVNCYYFSYKFFFSVYYKYIITISLTISYLSESTMGHKLFNSFNDINRVYSKYKLL